MQSEFMCWKACPNQENEQKASQAQFKLMDYK